MIKAEGVSKKFAKDLKKSLLYGMADVARGVLGKPFDPHLRADEFWAVRDVSFEVRRGECLGLIGHNGAGKSTLLKMLNGLIRPDKGRIEMRGRVGALIELGAGFNPILTGRENIYNSGAVLGFSRAEIRAKFDEIVAFSELEEFLDMPVQNYSTGMRVRLGYAVASQMEPDILLLDEVLAVGDVGFRMKCFNRIFELGEQTATILVSHSMPQISRVATEIILMEKGEALYHTADLASGIERYFDSLGTENASVGGNRKARLNHIKILSNKMDTLLGIPIIDEGEDLVLNLRYNIDNNIQIYSVHLGIMDRESKTIAQCFSRNNNFTLTNDGQEKSLTINIPQIPLAMGVYSLNINFMGNTVADARGAYLGHYRSIIKFKVTGKSALIQSPIQLKGRWSLTS